MGASEHFKNRLFKGLTLNIIVLGLVSLLTDISSEMILPILPIFLITVLGANMAILGLIEGLADSIASMLKVFSGWFSDKYQRRKPLILFGYSLSTFVKPFLAAATSWSHILIIRVFDRVGKGIRNAPRDALIAESCEKCDRGKAFGLHRAMDTTGAIIGPLIGYALLVLVSTPTEQTMRLIFLLSVIPAFAAVVVVLLMVKEPMATKAPGIKNQDKISFKTQNLRNAFKSMSAEFKMFIVISLIFSFGNFSYAFFIVRANDIGISPSDVILLYLLFNVVYAITAIPAGMLSDTMGRKPVIITGYALLGIIGTGFAFATSSAHIIGLFIIYGFFMGINEGVQRAYVTDIVEPEVRATAIGLFNTTVGIVIFPASLIAGMLWQYINVQAAFLLSAVTSLIALIMFTGTIWKTKK
ncbi:MAG: MFS transporter [Thermoplasmata archaeon]